MAHRLMRIIFVGTLCIPLFSAHGQSARIEYSVRYEAKLEQAALTGSFDDDLALARQMLDDVKDENESDSMVSLVCEHVYKTASVFVASYELGIEAMVLQSKRIPSKKLTSLSYATSLQQKLYQRSLAENRKERGETLVTMILEMGTHELEAEQWKAAGLYFSEAKITAEEIGSSKYPTILAQLSKMEAMQYVADLKQRFERNSSDSKAIEGLMRLYVIELDDPAQAMPYQFATADADMAKFIELATRNTDELFGTECLELGDWYMSLVERASSGAKPLMQARAKRYYEKYLILHRTADSKRERVTQAIADLGSAPNTANQSESTSSTSGGFLSGMIKAVENLGLTGGAKPAESTSAAANTPKIATPPAKPSIKGFEPEEGWVDLLAPIDLIKHVGRGVWDQKDGDLIAEPPTPAQITTPFVPTGDYIVEAKFTRISVGGSAAFHLPVGEQHVMLLLSERRRRQRDYVAGLDIIDDKPVIENETATPFELKTATLYTVHIEVIGVGSDEIVISVTVNDEPLLDWTGAATSLGASTEWSKFSPTALGVGCDGGGTFQFHGARLMMISGEASELP